MRRRRLRRWGSRRQRLHAGWRRGQALGGRFRVVRRRGWRLRAERAAAGARPVESPDVAAVKALAWQLQRACELAHYPLCWAVGLFRSPAGSETVVMSNEGSGYVPAGVYLPRGVRLLVADPLVD